MATEVIKTIGTGGDYATISAAWAAIPTNLGTVDEQWTLQLLPGVHTGPNSSCATKFTSSSCYIKITSAPGANWNDKQKPIRPRLAENARFTVESWGNTPQNLHLVDVEVEMATNAWWTLQQNANAWVVSRLLITKRIASAAPWFYNGTNTQFGTPYVSNCYYIFAMAAGDWTNYGLLSSGGNPTLECVAVGNTIILAPWTTGSTQYPSAIGYGNATGSAVSMQNNICMGNTISQYPPRTFYASGDIGSSYWSNNAYSGANTDAPNSTQGLVQNVNAASTFVSWSTVEAECDFRLKPGAIATFGGGANISWLTTVDCYGDPRPANSAKGASQSEYQPGLPLTPTEPIALTGTLSVEASITMGKSLNFTADLGISGTMGIEGAFKGALPYLEFSAELALTGTMGVEATVTFSTKITTGLPDGWYILKVLESVPNPNFGTPYGQNYFVRWTYLGYDDNDIMLAASGSDLDCYGQLLSVAQSRTQQQPYTGL